MTDPNLVLIEKYASRGVLVDTNILLLFVVGAFDRELIPRFKRTSHFAPEDYDLLARLLRVFHRTITTPNVLTEVSNLTAQLGEPAKTGCMRLLAQGIALLDEHYVASAEAAPTALFPRLGLTDAGILLLAGGESLVLTDDLELFVALAKAGVDAINFNHVRAAGWK